MLSYWAASPYWDQKVRGRRDMSSSRNSSNSSKTSDGQLKDSLKHDDTTKLLPKLPVPEVKDTMNKYLNVLSTVLTPLELHTTLIRVLEFMTPGGWAEKLQAYLLKRREETDNWVYDWWLHDMYLNVRSPLMVNVNTTTNFPRQQFTDTNQMLRLASKLVQGALSYKSLADSGKFPDDIEKLAGPVCREQYVSIFSSCRRPGVPSDHLLTGLGTQGPPFIVVACRDQFYKVEVEEDGVALSEEELFCQLCKVHTAAQRHSAGSPSVGVFTAINRSAWADAWKKLAAEPRNQRNLEALENCVLVLCLDKATRDCPDASSPFSTFLSTSSRPQGEAFDDTHLVAQAQYAMHGEGASFNTCNRWFDKPLQFCVSEDGVLAANNEHSVCEASVLDSVLPYVTTYWDPDPDPTGKGSGEQESRCLKEPEWLTWIVTPDLESDIARAKEEADRIIANVDTRVGYFDEFGTDLPRSRGISPDAFMQLAFQLTYYRLYGRMAMSYESASLLRFRRGRVDNIRSNTSAALAWIHAAVGEQLASVSERQALFLAAAEKQKAYAKETIAGHGIDSHLIGLHKAARDLNVLDSIPLFCDPSFQKAFRFPLSTSQIPTDKPYVPFYGPDTPDGYGIPYNLFPSYMIITVTSFRDCAETDSSKFLRCLEACLLEMRDDYLLKD